MRDANGSPEGFAVVESMDLRAVLKAVDPFRPTKRGRAERPALGSVVLVVEGTSLTAYASDSFMLGRVAHTAIHGSLNVAVLPDGLLSVLPSNATTTLSVQADGLAVATRSTRFLMPFPTYHDGGDQISVPDYEALWSTYSRKQEGASGGRFNGELLAKVARAFPHYVDLTVASRPRANTLIFETGDPYTMKTSALLLGVVAKP